MNTETAKILISFIKNLIKEERVYDCGIGHIERHIDEDGIETLINIVKALANLKEGDL